MTRVLIFLLALVLGACGGGSAPVPASGSGTPTVLTISGVAATGAAISGRIFLKDSAGHEQFVDTTDGRFSFALTGLTAPYMLKASWTAAGTAHTLYSFSTASAGGTANITPLTHMALARAAGTSLLDAVYDAGAASAFTAIATALPSALAQVESALAPLLAGQGVAALDLVSGVFAADHTGMDAVLDGISVSYAAGNVTVSDKTSGEVLFEAPVADLTHAMSVLSWTAQDASAAADPDVAVASNGDSLVAWSETIGSHSFVRARVLPSGTTSTTSTLSISGDAGLPKVAFDAAANALVVWTQFENGRNDIWASRYVAATKTWTSPVHLSAANAVADANVPDLAVDAAGNAFVVWHQGDGRANHFDVLGARYAAAADAWTAPLPVSAGIDSAFNPHVAVSAAGLGLVAWEQGQDDGTVVSNGPQDIWARSLGSAGALGTATRLNAVTGDVDGVYGQIAVAADSQGNGMALWVQSSGASPLVIQVARLAQSGGWQASVVITSNALDSSYGPHLAFDSAGNAVAIWQQQTGVGAFAGVNRFDATTGWGSSAAIGNDVPGDVYDPHIAVDGAGNATAIWYQQLASSTSLMGNRSLAGAAWGASRVVASPLAGGFSIPVPRVATNAAGHTVVVWGADSQ